MNSLISNVAINVLLKLLSYSVSNNLCYGVVSGGVVAACILSSLVTTSHSGHCNNCKEKNFLHNFFILKKLILTFDFLVFSEIGCKITTFFAYIQKKM